MLSNNKKERKKKMIPPLQIYFSGSSKTERLRLRGASLGAGFLMMKEEPAKEAESGALVGVEEPVSGERRKAREKDGAYEVYCDWRPGPGDEQFGQVPHLRRTCLFCLLQKPISHHRVQKGGNWPELREPWASMADTVQLDQVLCPACLSRIPFTLHWLFGVSCVIFVPIL